MSQTVVEGNVGRGVGIMGGSASIVGCTFEGNLKSSIFVTDNRSSNIHNPVTGLDMYDNMFIQAFKGAAAVDYIRSPNVVMNRPQIAPGFLLAEFTDVAFVSDFDGVLSRSEIRNNRRPRHELLAMQAESAKKNLNIARQGMIQWTTGTGDPKAGLECSIAADQLQDIRICELRAGKVHTGRALHCTLISEVDKMTSIMGIVEDDSGEAVFAAFYDLLPATGVGESTEMCQKMFPKGTTFIIKEPYFKLMANGEFGIRAHRATTAWQQPIVPPALKKGTAVKITGLMKRAELNGRVGVVVAYAPNAAGRWAVKLDPEPEFPEWQPQTITVGQVWWNYVGEHCPERTTMLIRRSNLEPN
jgi:hypothetical protein